MTILDGIFKAFILAGTIQGFITGFLLFYAPGNRHANRLLGALIWLISLAGFDLYIDYFTGWVYSNSVIAMAHALIPLLYAMAFGPLIFFYIRSVLEPGFHITKKDKRHFIPVIVDLVPQLTAIIFIVGVLAKWFVPKAEPWGIFIDEYNIYADIPRWMSLAIYVACSRKYIARWKNENSRADTVSSFNIRWLKLFTNLLTVFLVIWFVYLVPYVIPKYQGWLLGIFNWYPVYIPLSVLIYWLGIKGVILAYGSQGAEKGKKTVSILDDTTIRVATNALAKVMQEDKLYLDPSLTINQLAERAGLSPKIMSAVLNQHIGKGFNEYVNSYRVNEVKERLLRNRQEHLTLAGIAMECGFNSQASFQRIFKQQTGMAPSEFRKAAMSNGR